MTKLMIKRISLFFALIAGFISCTYGSENTENNTEALASDDIIVEDGNSLLWKIEGKNSQTSYIYGTMHMINEEYYNFTPLMAEKIMESDAIIMEVGGMPDPIETFKMMSLDSGEVYDYFSTEQLEQLMTFFETNLQTDKETFHKTYSTMRPFFILQAISQSYFEEGAMSYDLDIMAMAAQNKIPLIGLETIEEQLGFFDVISNDEMASIIMESIVDYKKGKKDTDKLMKLYAKQRVDKLIPLMKKQSPEFMKFEDIFLYNRNKAWIPKIISEIQEKKCFIAVGAAHLFGEGGVLDLLEKEGYKITPIFTGETED